MLTGGSARAGPIRRRTGARSRLTSHESGKKVVGSAARRGAPTHRRTPAPRSPIVGMVDAAQACAGYLLVLSRYCRTDSGANTTMIATTQISV